MKGCILWIKLMQSAKFSAVFLPNCYVCNAQCITMVLGQELAFIGKFICKANLTMVTAARGLLWILADEKVFIEIDLRRVSLGTCTYYYQLINSLLDHMPKYIIPCSPCFHIYIIFPFMHCQSSIIMLTLQEILISFS